MARHCWLPLSLLWLQTIETPRQKKDGIAGRRALCVLGLLPGAYARLCGLESRAICPWRHPLDA